MGVFAFLFNQSFTIFWILLVFVLILFLSTECCIWSI